MALRCLPAGIWGKTREESVKKQNRRPAFRLRRGNGFGCSVQSLGLLAGISFPQRRESSRWRRRLDRKDGVENVDPIRASGQNLQSDSSRTGRFCPSPDEL